jgi:threonine aldolase
MTADSSIVDLRSDLLARPTSDMLAAMVRAGQQRRCYGFREDPDLQELEALSADLLGHEDALFFPTCTMANQTALMAFCKPGETLLADAHAHVAEQEKISTHGVAGAVVARRSGVKGHLTPELVRAALEHTQENIALVWLENTHNRGGGSVMPTGWQASISAACKQHGVPLHLDGSRIWNAAVASNTPARELARGTDSVAVSLNKALGVPVGAMLAGSASFIDEAARIRGMLGGGWRPTGIIAAAGVVALRSLPARLADDHAMAKSLATRLANEHAWLTVDAQAVVTNIVVVTPKSPAMPVSRLLTQLQEQGVLALPFLENSLRLVTYSEIREREVERVLIAFAAIAPVLATA